jgi:CHAT domain-containing protein/tetratricopeptide (TPR) repeat protein
MISFNNHILFYLIKHNTHRYYIQRSGVVSLATIVSILFWGLLNPSISRAENLAIDQADIISQIEQAQFLVKKEKFEQAIKQLVKAYNLADSRQDYLSSASLAYLIGEIYEHRGRFQEALTQYEQGLTTLAILKAGAAKIVGQALDELRGSQKAYTPGDGAPIGTDLYRGEIENVGERLRQSPKTLESELALVLTMNVGNMYLTQNQYPQANALYKKALEIAGNLKRPLTAARIQANLAWGAIKQRRFDQADVWLKAAMSETDTDVNLLESRRTLLALGVHHRETGRVSEAITELKKAAALYELADDQSGRCRALAHLATAYQRQGDLQQAKTYYIQALELNRQVKDDTTAWHASGGLAKTYHKLGDLAAAVQHYENYMDAVDKLSSSYETDQGKVAILENHAAIAGEYVNVTVELAGQTGDFIHVRKAIERGRARALRDLLSWKLSRGGRKPGQMPAGQVLYGDAWPSIKMDSADYMEGQEAEGTATQPMAQMALGVASRTNRSIEEEDPAVAEESQRVRPSLTATLQTYVLPERTVILVHSSEPDSRTGGAIVNIKAASLAYIVARYRLSLDVDRPRGVAVASGALSASPTATAGITDEANSSRQLYDLLIKPVRKLLPDDPQKPLVIIPHKSLWLLPFTALRAENGDFFGDQHVLTYAASESTWRLVASRARSSDHRSPTAWIVGNPQMPARVESCQMTFAMDPLPGAEQEAREIADLFRSQKIELFTGSQADRLRLDAWHPQFSVLHLATHGVGCAADPLSSFILLKALDDSDLELDKQSETISLTGDSRYPVTLTGAQKILKSREMPEIKELSYPGLLDARSIINNFNLDADLVSLSACQTGLGQLTGEGLIGFTRAFMTSGARSLLVSLWRVDDRSTRELMVSFYRQYLEHGNKGLALQHAMAETRKRYPNPRYWAGFTLVGLAE